MSTAAEVAAHLDISSRSFRDLVEAGVIAHRPRGDYDLDACRVAYVRHPRNRAGNRDDKSPLAIARARSAAATARLKELEAAEREGELVSVHDAQVAMIAVAHQVRNRALAVPSKIDAQWGMATNAVEAQQLVKAEIYDMLQELSELDGNNLDFDLIARLMAASQVPFGEFTPWGSILRSAGASLGHFPQMRKKPHRKAAGASPGLGSLSAGRS